MTRLFLAVLLVSLPIEAAATLKGLLVRNEIGGQPVANVAVGADGANPTVSTSLGAFRLEFPLKKPGDRVKLTASMAGMVVVNWFQLDVYLPADAGAEVLTLVLAREADREEMARRFFRLRTFEASESIYKRQLAEAGQDRARLARELEQAKAAAVRTAEELAKVRPGESSAVYEQAIRLYVRGKVREAIETLDEARLREKSAAAEARIAEVTRNWVLRGQLTTTQFRFPEAERAYAEAVRLSPGDFGACISQATLLQKLNRHAMATTAYVRCLNLARTSGDSERIAMTLNDLGNLQCIQNLVTEARTTYEEALAILRKLVAANHDASRPYVAMTLNNLGNLHRLQNRMEEARKVCEEALAVYSELAASNPDTYLPELAGTLTNLGVVYSALNRVGAARGAYEAALKIRRKLAESNHRTYAPLLAGTLNNLGNLDSDQGLKEEARKSYEEAAAILRKFAVENPGTYEPDFAMTLGNLGNLYLDLHQIEKSRPAYEKAIEVYRKLDASIPETYRPDLARVLWGMGRMYSEMGQAAEARQAFKEALEIFEKFAVGNRARYQPFVNAVKTDFERVKL